MRIFAGVRNDSEVVDNGYSVLALAISSEPLEIRPTLLNGDKESVVGFPCTDPNK